MLQSLRSDTATAAILFIFLTAKGEREDMRVGMNQRADDYLTKPVSKAELIKAVAARLQRSA